MTGNAEYNDVNLWRLFADMDPKRRLRALKGAFRSLASKVRRTAISNLRSSIRTDSDLERGVRSVVYTRTAGFRVTIGTQVMKTKRGATKATWTGFGFHKNRKGKEKPVLIWAEGGTIRRTSRKRSRYNTPRGWRTGKYRGQMKRYGFMEKTANEMRGRVTDAIREEAVAATLKIAQKYGCI